MIEGVDGLLRLATELEVSGPRAQAASYKATQVEGHRMRDDWRQAVTGATGLPGLPAALSYDMLPTGLRSVTTEVGFDDRGQGELANLVEFGSSEHPPIRPAAERVLKGGEDRLTKFLETIEPL